jgi:hypothetical protein
MLRFLFTGLNYLTRPGLWGGTVSSMDLKVNVTQEMNGVVYTCQSLNEALQRSIHEAITLQVLCTYMYYEISFSTRNKARKSWIHIHTFGWQMPQCG